MDKRVESISEALNILISAAQVAYEKGNVYTMQESWYIWDAISFINSLSNKNAAENPPTSSEQD